jgi:hypothetical protein
MGPNRTRAPRPWYFGPTAVVLPVQRSLLSNPGERPHDHVTPSTTPTRTPLKQPTFDHLVTSPRFRPAHPGPGSDSDKTRSRPRSQDRPRTTEKITNFLKFWGNVPKVVDRLVKFKKNWKKLGTFWNSI